MPYTATHRSLGPIVLVRHFQMSQLALFSIVAYGKSGRSDVGISNSHFIKFNSLLMYRIPLSLLAYSVSRLSCLCYSIHFPASPASLFLPPFSFFFLLCFRPLCGCLSRSLSRCTWYLFPLVLLFRLCFVIYAMARADAASAIAGNTFSNVSNRLVFTPRWLSTPFPAVCAY